MALDPRTGNRLKDALGRTVAVEKPADAKAFKAKLKALSLPAIRKQLDSGIISRKWKRDLAEAEFDRRDEEEDQARRDTEADDERTAAGTATSKRRRNAGMARTINWVGGVLIAASIVVIGYAAYELWRM
jgi:hypothetical protein